MKTLVIVLVVLAVLVLGFWWMWGRDNNSEVVNSPTPTATVTASPSPSSSASVSPSPLVSVSVGLVKSFTVTGKPYSFSPSTITVNKGDTVKITFVNQSGTHNWTIDEFNAATKTIQGGQQETIQFVANKTGTFEYYCSVGTHRQMGMKGTLIVK